MECASKIELCLLNYTVLVVGLFLDKGSFLT